MKKFYPKREHNVDGVDCAKTMTQLEQDGPDDNPVLVGKLHRKTLLINAEWRIECRYANKIRKARRA